MGHANELENGAAVTEDRVPAVKLSFAELLAIVDSGAAVPVDPVSGRGKATAHDNTSAERIAVAFAVMLRRAGLAVPVGAVTTFAEALAAVGLETQAGVYWAGRSVLVRRPEDIDLYDRAFVGFWLGRVGGSVETIEQHVTIGLDSDDGANDDPDSGDGPDGETIAVRYSAAEVLREKDFAAYSVDEFAEARRAMALLRVVGSPRRCRRLRPVKGRAQTARPDLRRTVRKALRTDGVAMRRAFLAPSMKPRRIVLLCDVSGSMESYARALLRFCQAAVVGRGRVEAFALGTRLTRLTRELSSRDPDEALRKSAGRVADWSGGTRLGDGIRAFNDQWGVRGMARGAIVVILSDGWDRGDPAVLAEQMARLSRVAFRVVWVNPLKAAPGYAPLARGMAAALPFVDSFIEGHSLASLETLAAVISR